MAKSQISDVPQHVAERVRWLTGSKIVNLRPCYLDRDLRMDPDDFIELCEELEETFDLNLRPYFEDGQPEQRYWFFWTRPTARDVTVGELAEHIEQVLSTRE